MGDDQGYPKDLHGHQHPCEVDPSKTQIELPVRYDKRVWDAQRGNFWSGGKMSNLRPLIMLYKSVDEIVLYKI